MDPSVTFTYGILIGVLIGLLFKRYNDALWKWLEKLAPPPAKGAVIVPSQTAQASAEPAIKTGEVLPPIKGFAPEALAAELRALELVIEPEASSAAHPRAFENNPKFLEAVQLLTQPEVPIDVVEDYALGPRWVLSCAALAALAKRPDRDEVVSHVLDYFDNITPWAIYFALAYFLACNPRPAVGAPLRHAKDWWRDNIFIARCSAITSPSASASATRPLSTTALAAPPPPNTQ